jgi:hypothetical protein
MIPPADGSELQFLSISRTDFKISLDDHIFITMTDNRLTSYFDQYIPQPDLVAADRRYISEKRRGFQVQP